MISSVEAPSANPAEQSRIVAAAVRIHELSLKSVAPTAAGPEQE
jgi:hypothetical protein